MSDRFDEAVGTPRAAPERVACSSEPLFFATERESFVMDRASHDRNASEGSSLHDRFAERVERALSGHDISRAELDVVIEECERLFAVTYLMPRKTVGATSLCRMRDYPNGCAHTDEGEQCRKYWSVEGMESALAAFKEDADPASTITT